MRNKFNVWVFTKSVVYAIINYLMLSRTINELLFGGSNFYLNKSGFGIFGSGEMIRSYTTEVSLFPIADTTGGKGDAEHWGGAGGKYEGLGGLGTFPGVC